VLIAAVSALGQPAGSLKIPAARSRVVTVHDPAATEAFKPIRGPVREMAKRGVMTFTGKTSMAAAWQSLISPKEIVGIKVFSSPGPNAGTRPALVGALIEGLLEARLPPTNIIIWDKHQLDLRRAGFFELGEQYGVQVQGSADCGYDEEVFYFPDRPVPGQLVWGDVEFGRKGEGIGRRSFLSKLLTKRITKIISVAPLLNHNSAGVSGHLYSLAMGSVDNAIRFENDVLRLSKAVPEIYALPTLGDRVVLNITDALICQYQGEQRGLLHYSTALNELRFSKDPVALDFLSLRELERTRLASSIPIPRDQSFTNQMELLSNASLLELGVSDSENIQVERVR
jgi:hypothetical protein